MKKFLWPLFAMVAVVFLSVGLLYPPDNGLGKGFSLAVVYILTRPFALYIGAIFILGRLIGLLKNSQQFFYIFLGYVNLLVPIVSVVLYAKSESNKTWMIECMFNLVIGFIIFIDSIRNYKSRQ